MIVSNYKQFDTRWATLGYPFRPWLIRNCGCGEVAICNVINTMLDETPKTIQPYMVKFAEPHGNGTYHYGIPVAMAHYGLTEVYEHSTMAKLFAELAKGERVAILLMGSRNAGNKGVHWTGSGHFVCATSYKKEGGKNWLYVVDSASTSPLRNGWITYEDNIRGACLKCWSGKISMKLVVDGHGGTRTVNRLQEFLGVAKTGKLTMVKSLYQYCESWNAITYGSADSTVKAMQRWLGITQSGKWDKDTSLALQKRLNIKQDGYFGTNSMKSLQRYLNMRDKAVYPAPKPTPKPQPKTIWDNANAWAEALCKSPNGKYKVFGDDPKTQECPLCHKDAYYGYNCIGASFGYWRHGAGIPCRCNCEVINNAMMDKILRSNHETAVKLVKECTGLTQVTVVSNGGKAIPADKLKQGDIIIYYDGKTAQHMGVDIGNGRLFDCARGHTPQMQCGKLGVDWWAKEEGWQIKIAIRYTGKVVL